MPMSKEQLVGLVSLIVAADVDEAQILDWIGILEDNVPDPNVSDLIYQQRQELTPEQIVERALAYKPIIL